MGVHVTTKGLFSAINSSTVNNVNPLFQVRALELAQAQMDEIIGKRYDDKSPLGGFPPCDSTDPKTDLGDVDDYDGFTTVPAGYGGYTMSVAVTNVTLSSRPAKLITITVDSAASTPVTLSAYRGNF